VDINQILFWVLSSVCLLCFLVIAIYYFFVFGKLAFYKSQEQKEFTPPVSVVICARNEAQNLFNHLPKLFAQNYPQFQLVVVNDCSWDESEQILEEFQKKHSNLHVVNLKEEKIKDHDKKLAVTLGIKGAKYDNLLFTDADCIPANENWIKSMTKNFVDNSEIIIAYGPYKKTSGFLNKIIRFDTFFNAVNYLSAAIAGKTYMGVGRNMGYTKKIFFDNKGFASHYFIQSGDDDLFINKVASKAKVKTEINPDSFTYSVSKDSWKAWLRQKKRHLSTSKFYRLKDKLRIGLFAMANYLFLLTWGALFFFKTIEYQEYYLAGILLLKFIIQWIVLNLCAKKLNEKDLWFIAPFFELFLFFVYPYLHIKNIFIKQQVWK
jgi:poly-beta-1,6-N-acetyl-D-glucosamine synthase